MIQPNTPLPYAALAQQQAASALLLGLNSAFAASGIVATGAIPNDNTAAPVVVVFAPITIKRSGILKINASLSTAPNQNGGAQAVVFGLAVLSSLPTAGVTTSPAITPAPATTAPTGASATPSTEYLTAPVAFGTTVYVCALLNQSVAGAFALVAGGAKILVTEE